MPDDFDRAAERELQIRDDALRQQGLRAGLGDASDWNRLSSAHCLAGHCGTEIPEARRKALPGVKYCIECQQMLERKGKR